MWWGPFFARFSWDPRCGSSRVRRRHAAGPEPWFQDFIEGRPLAADWATALVAYRDRFGRFLLDEAVLPPMALPRGVPAAISRMVQYVAVAIGLYFAALASGGRAAEPRLITSIGVQQLAATGELHQEQRLLAVEVVHVHAASIPGPRRGDQGERAAGSGAPAAPGCRARTDKC